MRKIFSLILVIILAGVAKAQTPLESPDVALLKNILVDNSVAGPGRERLVDVYKCCFQDVFGPEHLVRDAETCKRYILEELALNDTFWTPITQADYTFTAPDSNYVRVNLALIRNGVIPIDLFVEALVESTEVLKPVSQPEWKRIWEQRMESLRQAPPEIRPQNFAQDSTRIAELLARGGYVMHHSPQFNWRTHFHYRLIRRDIFEEKILPLVPTKK